MSTAQTRDALREALARCIYDVSNRWIAPNFGEGWQPRPLEEDERTRRLHLDYADSILAGPLSRILSDLTEARALAQRVGNALPEDLRDIDLAHAVRQLRMAHDSAHRQVGDYAKAIRLMLPFLDMAAGEGLGFVEQEDGSPEMDGADICDAVAPLIGCDEPQDSAWLIIREQGWKDLRAARSVTEPTEGEDADLHGLY